MAGFKCWRCGEILNTDSGICPSCGAEINGASANTYIRKPNNMNRVKNTVGYYIVTDLAKTMVVGCLVLLMVIIFGVFVIEVFRDSNPQNRTLKCQVCGNEYVISDTSGNARSIALTNMCKRCYTNYKYTQDALNGALEYYGY